MKQGISLRMACMMLPAAASAAMALDLQLNRADGLFPSGEVAVVSCRQADAATGGLVRVRILRDWNLVREKRVALEQDNQVLMQMRAEEPASFQIEVMEESNRVAAIGFVTCPDQIRVAAPAPADLDEFWARKRHELADGFREAVQSPATSPDVPPEFHCFDVEIPCSTSTPARGYFVKPAVAATGSLPAVIFLHAAGVAGDWCLSKPWNAYRYARMGQGALALDLNAHGMLNGQPGEYYRELDKQLKGHAATGLDAPDTWYYVGMYQRLIAAIDFICSQPEWDHRRLLLVGESQGGGQALAGAGLEARVSHVYATVPALGDLSAPLHGRRGGFPNVLRWGTDAAIKARHARTVAYCDVAYLAARSRARALIEVGLVDPTCPPASVLAAYNALPGPKTLLAIPFRAHQDRSLPALLRERREDMVTPVREEFLREFFQVRSLDEP